jgi:hypothetical protein
MNGVEGIVAQPTRVAMATAAMMKATRIGFTGHSQTGLEPCV